MVGCGGGGTVVGFAVEGIYAAAFLRATCSIRRCSPTPGIHATEVRHARAGALVVAIRLLRHLFAKQDLNEHGVKGRAPCWGGSRLQSSRSAR